MILTVDIGNTNIAIALHEANSKSALFYENIPTDKERSEEVYEKDLLNLLKTQGYDIDSVTETGLSSVVAKLTTVFINILKRITGKEPFVMSSEADLPFIIDTEDPSEVGTDLLCDVVGALDKYPAPLVIFSLGTATVTMVVSGRPALEGVLIYPGVNTSLRTLSEKADALPDIDIDHPGKLIGRNTKDSMVSGVVYGTASMLDGLIGRIEKEMNEEVTAVATGGLAHVICPYCERKVHVEDTLLMEGLWKVVNRSGVLR